MRKKEERKDSPYGPGQTFGRPAEYTTAEDLRIAVQDYFDYCRNNDLKLTVTGLTLHLGFAHRASLDDYEAKGPDFFYIIKRARSFVENGYEQRLLSEEGSPAGAIFALKNMGWKDKSESDVNLTGSISPDQWLKDNSNGG